MKCMLRVLTVHHFIRHTKIMADAPKSFKCVTSQTSEYSNCSRQYFDIEQDESFTLTEHRHAAHCLIYSHWNTKLFDLYDAKAAVLMQVRSDGFLGFPGGIIDAGETCIDALKRELVEELNFDPKKHHILNRNHMCSHINHTKKLVVHFYAKEIDIEAFKEMEINAVNATHFNLEVFGNCRVPLFTMKDNYNGFPAFLNNNFIGNAKEQLLSTLVKLNILGSEEINCAVNAANDVRNKQLQN